MQSKASYLSVIDHSVSGESFDLVLNEDLEMLETVPQPSLNKLPDYYDSEDYISHTDGRRNAMEILYQWVKRISLRRKLKLINKLSISGNNLCDIGCGTGDFLRIAQDNKWTVTGVEPNTKARTIANQKVKGHVHDSSALETMTTSSFDVITLWHVLEHLPDLDGHIDRFYHLLKPNGYLLVAVPNFKSFDAHHYKAFWAAYDVPRHLWHFSSKSIRLLFEARGFSLKSILPMPFDAYYVSLLSEKYKTGRANPFKAFWIGWKSNYKAKRSKEYSSHLYILKRQD